MKRDWPAHSLGTLWPLPFTHLHPPIPPHPFCAPSPHVGPPPVLRYRKSFREVSSCRCHAAPEQKGLAVRSLPVGGGRWAQGLRCSPSGGLGLWGAGAVYTVLWGGSLMGVRDCDCHQLPDFLSLVPNPRLTERRNSLLLAPRASHPRP